MSKNFTHIEPTSLASLPERVQYLRDFIEFTPEDAATLHAAKPAVAPLIDTVVTAVYDKLLSFDITAKAFVPRQTGFEGPSPTKLEELSQEHPQIKFRKDFLKGYIVKLVTMDYGKMESWDYLDKVGLMHTGVAGFTHRKKKSPLRVELMHCSILLGYVEDILVNAVITHPELDISTKNAVCRAVNKVLWIQNDLFARHYAEDPDVHPVSHSLFSPDKRATLTVALGCLAGGAVLGRYFL